MSVNAKIRPVKLIFGLFLYAAGTYLSIPANIGLTPWNTFHMGVSNITGISYGNVMVAASLVIVAIDCLLYEKIGIGTILNALLIGKFVDLFMWLDLVPICGSFAAGVFVLLTGQLLISVGSYFYISPGLGCGPRDLLMVAIGKRLIKTPIGVVRGLIEGTALLIGWLLGARVGVGTVISIFGISVILEYTFRLLRFDVRATQHEDILSTLKKAWGIFHAR